MATNKMESKTQLNFRIEKQLLKDIKAQAKTEGLNHTDWIIKACRVMLGQDLPSDDSLVISELIVKKLEDKLLDRFSESDKFKAVVKDCLGETKSEGDNSAQTPEGEAPNPETTVSTSTDPSQDEPEGTKEAKDVLTDLESEIEPPTDIKPESDADQGIQNKELYKEILDIPQSTFSNWCDRRGTNQGKPSRGRHVIKWDEFMQWEKRGDKWYRV